jgi:hypothetical protein
MESGERLFKNDPGVPVQNYRHMFICAMEKSDGRIQFIIRNIMYGAWVLDHLDFYEARSTW